MGSVKSLRHMRMVVCVLLFAVHAPLSAQDFQGFSEEDFFEGDIPIVLTASRLIQERSEVPGSITIIDRQMIEASAARDLPDIFRLVPGFQIGHGQGRTLVTYHGNADEFARRMQVRIDGRSVYLGLTGGVEWNDLPLSVDDIERVEVFRGPNAVSYGSNSFVGVINIITRHPSTLQGLDFAVESGQGGYKRAFARKSGQHNGFSYRLTAEEWESDGVSSSVDSNRRTRFNFRGEFRPNLQDTFDIMFGHVDGFSDNGSGSENSPFRTVAVRSHYQHLRWKRSISADEEVNFQFYHNYYREEDTYDVLIQGFIPYTFSTSVGIRRYDFEYEHTRRIDKSLRLVWGAEARLDEGSGIHDFGIFNTDDIIRLKTYRAFIDSEWRVSPDLLISTGALVEKNNVTGTDLSPRLSVNYKLSPQHSLRFVVSEATRVPNQFETNALGVLDLQDSFGITDVFFQGNRNLDPERIRSYEIGYYGTFFDKQLAVDARLFREEIDDAIVAYEDETFNDFDGEVDTYDNFGFQDITGIEFGIEYKPSERTRINLNASFANQDGEYLREIVEGGALDIRESDDTTPKRTYSALVIHKLDSETELSAGYYKVSNVDLFGGDDTGGYSTIDLRLARNFKVNNTRGKLEFILKNGFGEYFDFRDDYILEKNAFISLRLDFD